MDYFEELALRAELDEWGLFLEKRKWKDYEGYFGERYVERTGYYLRNFNYVSWYWGEWGETGPFFASLEEVRDVLGSFYDSLQRSNMSKREEDSEEKAGKENDTGKEESINESGDGLWG